MKTLPSCLCILGFASASLAGGVVLMDQIGTDDGSNIDLSNMTANQIFEASFAQYNVACVDDFDSAGSAIMSVELVFGGWNGYAGPTGISGYSVNLYSDKDNAPCADLNGDAYTATEASGDLVEEFGGLAGMSKIGLPVNGGPSGNINGVSVVPNNEFGTNGQTGSAISFEILEGGGSALDMNQANPGGGFGLPCPSATPNNVALRVMGGTADPCSGALPEVCAADVSGPDEAPDGFVNVSDLLAVIGNWGATGDGTYRPVGDCAPAPNGDCTVNVSDLLAVIGDWGSDCVARGACCLGDGSCTEDVAEADCSGDWLGTGSDCGSCLSGACCATDGSCSNATEAGCDGSYQGDGTDCADAGCEPAPDNNTCEAAIAAAEGDNAIDNTSATSDGAADFTACDNFGEEGLYNDLYWTYTASCEGDVTISTCNTVDFDSRIAVYTDCGSEMLACNDDALSGACGLTSELTLAMAAGESIVIRIGSFSEGGTGSGTFNISCAGYEQGACCIGLTQCVDGLIPPECTAFGGTHQGGGTLCSDIDCDPTPLNDTCEGAEAVGPGAHAFDTTYANPEWADPNDAVCSGTYLDWAGSPDVFFSFSPDSDGTINVSLCDAASYDTSLAIYEGGCNDGDGSHNIACNGDASGETGCQSYYSAVDNLPVIGGQTYLIRIGGWNAATGAGTMTLSYTGGSETAACCVDGGCAGEVTYGDCDALGGLWVQGEDCSTVSCPLPFNGCDGSQDSNEEDDGCSICQEDGFDTADDCNAGLNGDGTLGAYTLGNVHCGTASVYVDGPTGGQYRDTDWYDDNGVIDAGGTFTLTHGAGGAHLLGIVDIDALAFVDYAINDEGFYQDGYDITVAAGNYCLWIGPSDWNVAWDCASGGAAYSMHVE